MNLNTVPQDPALWTLDHVKLAAGITTQRTLAIGVGDGPLYMSGDHLQDGRTWQGPGREEDGSILPSNQVRIRNMLAPIPEALGCVKERVNGACGNEADIDFQPTEPAGKEGAPSDAQVAYAAQLKRDMSRCWDDNDLWGGMDVSDPTGVRGAVALASSWLQGRACLRAFWSNPAQAKDRRTALRRIKVVALSPDRCGIYTDPDTHREVGWFLFKDTDDRECAEVWYSQETKSGEEVTVWRMLTAGVAEEKPTIIPTGGLLPIVHVKIGTLLTEPVLRLQGSVDTLNTLLMNLCNAHGLAARTELNTEDDGVWQASAPAGIEAPRTRVTDGVTDYFKPTVPTLGNYVIRKIRGFEYTVSLASDNEKETFGITTPSVHYHEPSPPSALIESADYERRALRDACHQGHRMNGLSGSTAEASGDAYEQARAMFVSDIESVGKAVDTAVAKLISWIMAAAEWRSGGSAQKFLNDWTVVAKSHPNAGPVSSATQTSTIALVEKKIISKSEGTARVGVQDVQGERDRIEAERTIGERSAEVAELIATPADPVTAWISAGIPGETAKALARGDGEPFVQQ